MGVWAVVPLMRWRARGLRTWKARRGLEEGRRGDGALREQSSLGRVMVDVSACGAAISLVSSPPPAFKLFEAVGVAASSAPGCILGLDGTRCGVSIPI